jgi:hypothetical protein
MAKLTITMEPELLSEHYLTPEHMRCIGLVAAEWSLLELNLRWEISAILGLRGATSVTALTGGAGAQALALAIRNLLDQGHLVEEQATPLRAAMTRVGDLTPLRNEIVHTAWLTAILPAGSAQIFAAPKIAAVGTFSGGKRKTMKTVEYTRKQMRQVALDIQEIRYAIAHKREPRPSPSLAEWRARQAAGAKGVTSA